MTPFQAWLDRFAARAVAAWFLIAMTGLALLCVRGPLHAHALSALQLWRIVAVVVSWAFLAVEAVHLYASTWRKTP